MGQSVSLFLVRAAGIVCAGMLLFAVFAGARADGAGNYGLTRFPGDNYDTVPANAAYPAAPMPPGYTPAPAGPVPAAPSYAPAYAPTYAPAPAPAYAPPPAPTGYYPMLNAGAVPPQAPPPQAYAAPPAYQPMSQPAQAPAEAYGYKPLPGAAPVYPAQRTAAADPYAYYQGAAQPGAMMRGNPDYVLGPGDKLHLIVFGETDLSGDFTVDGSGTVQLPLVGPVRAAGYTAPQMEAAVAGALAKGYLKSPRVAIEVATYRPFYIIGAVNRPGQYPYVDHMNALNAIALAGGFNPNAVESVVFVRREGSNQEVEVPVDRSTLIQPGDVVKVHNTFFSDMTNWLSPFSGVAGGAATAAVLQ